MKKSKNLKSYTPVLRRSVLRVCGAISASIRSDNTVPFEEMSQQWLAAGNTASDLNLRPPVTETNTLSLDQLKLLGPDRKLPIPASNPAK